MPALSRASRASLLLCLLASNLTTGCLAQLPAPAPPPRSEPIIDDPPKAPPEPSNGRIVFDVEGESGKVSRVTESIVSPGGMQQQSNAKTQMQVGTLGRRQELLCITPCIVDLRQGAHTFVFQAKDDPLRSSTADIAVTSKTTVVRHAIGREPSYSGSYLGGAALLLLGSGLTLMGGLATTVGAVGGGSDPEPSDTNGKSGASGSGSSAFLGIGLVMLGVGLATGTTGAILMSKHRPVEQAGSTTQWIRP